MTELLNGFLSGSAAWGVMLTLAAFALGTLINRATGKAIFNPLLLGSIFVIILLSVLNIPYADYKASASPVNYLLLPATISLAIPLYEKWDLLKENAAAIIAGISVGTLVSLGSALALALALGLTREQYATLLPKSVTTAISMDVAAERGGSPDGCHRDPDRHCRQPAGRVRLQVVPYHRPHRQGRGHRHLSPCRGHQQGPPDGRSGGRHERSFHRRGRCPHCRPLPALCRADPLNPDRITAHPRAVMCCLLYNANALCPSRQGAFSFWFSIVSSGG